MIKILYVGDAGVLAGPIFFASPFIMEIKGLSVNVFGEPLIKAFEKDNEIKVTHMSSWDAYANFPKTLEEMKQYDIIILSDVEAETLFFYPEFYTPSEYGKKTITKPNRLKAIKQFVESGGSLIMAGSWFTFAGRHGQSGWRKTPVADVLPVEILPEDDRVETPEGAVIEVLKPDHPIMKGIPWDTCPPFLGYNKVILKDGAELLATIKSVDTKEPDPLIAVWEYGKGRVMAFTSDPCPHWGMNFMTWDYYSKFWIQAAKWLVKKI